MAKIDELLAHVGGEKLRKELIAAISDMRRKKKFGLVYEEHIPETVLLAADTGLQIGAVVALRRDPTDNLRYRVDSLKNGVATISSGEVVREVSVSDLLVVTPFGQPVYPVLERTGESVVRSETKPFHIVINGENFHALQLLLLGYEGKVDLIYVDPPYNTGARDWKYNNNYVDAQDAWRHSKWLSMIEKRLRLAKRLLAPNGILVVTIDEHEVNNLGVLLREELFKELPQEAIQMVTIVINPKGVTQGRFSRVEEYAFFVFLGEAGVHSTGDDQLTLGADDLERAAASEGREKRPRWKGLLRSGTNARRVDRPNLFYPVLIDKTRGAVLSAGRPLPAEKAPDFKRKVNGLTPVWPVRRDGSLGNWGVGDSTLRDLITKGFRDSSRSAHTMQSEIPGDLHI
jgi:adenine-specific DNA-methyltransferase